MLANMSHAGTAHDKIYVRNGRSTELARFHSAGVAMYFSIRGVAPFLRISSSQMRWMRGT